MEFCSAVVQILSRVLLEKPSLSVFTFNTNVCGLRKCIVLLIFVPKIPSYKIVDVAMAIGSECKQEIVGIRPGEKLHEEMITPSDSYNTLDLGKYYVILPQQPIFNLEEYKKHFKTTPAPQGFSYNSGENSEWETVESLKELIKKYVDSNFAG